MISDATRRFRVAATFAINACLILILAGCSNPRRQFEEDDQDDGKEQMSPHEAVLSDTITVMEKAAEVLKKVKDKASAQQADPELVGLARRLQELVKKSNRLGTAGAAEDDRLLRRYGERLRRAVENFYQEKLRLNRVAGVNEAMKKSLDELDKVGKIQGKKKN